MNNIAIISGGLTRHLFKKANVNKYRFVIVINCATFDYEGDYYACLDEWVIKENKNLSRSPKIGWITDYECTILDGKEKVVPRRWLSKGCRFTYPLVLSVALEFQFRHGGVIDVFGHDQSLDKDHTKHRWKDENVWIDRIWQHYLNPDKNPIIIDRDIKDVTFQIRHQK